MDYTLDSSYDQWLAEVDADFDLALMFRELEQTMIHRWYDYLHRYVITLDGNTVTLRSPDYNDSYQVANEHHRRQLIKTNNFLYRTARKPGRRPRWLERLEAWDGTTLLPGEQIVVEEFAD